MVTKETACITLPLDAVETMAEYAARYIDLCDEGIADADADNISTVNREIAAVRALLGSTEPQQP